MSEKIGLLASKRNSSSYPLTLLDWADIFSSRQPVRTHVFAWPLAQQHVKFPSRNSVSWTHRLTTDSHGVPSNLLYPIIHRHTSRNSGRCRHTSRNLGWFRYRQTETQAQVDAKTETNSLTQGQTKAQTQTETQRHTDKKISRWKLIHRHKQTDVKMIWRHTNLQNVQMNYSKNWLPSHISWFLKKKTLTPAKKKQQQKQQQQQQNKIKKTINKITTTTKQPNKNQTKQQQKHIHRLTYKKLFNRDSY